MFIPQLWLLLRASWLAAASSRTSSLLDMRTDREPLRLCSSEHLAAACTCREAGEGSAVEGGQKGLRKTGMQEGPFL